MSKYFFAILIFIWSCTGKKSQDTITGEMAKPDTTVASKRSLIWSDEFNASGMPDSSKWSFDIGRGYHGWGNNELQFYTNDSSNARLDGIGNLVITARKGKLKGASFTSAKLKTKDLFAQTYGRFEARIKTPSGTGIWPAFWMLGANVDSVPWPNCGEIDIMEQRGQKPNIIIGTLHGPGYSGGDAVTRSYYLPNVRFDADYHIYAIEWGKGYIEFFVDDFMYQRITPENVTGQWVFDHPFYIILNVAVGGNFLGSPTAGTTFPQSMYVDYVKVYK